MNSTQAERQTAECFSKSRNPKGSKTRVMALDNIGPRDVLFQKILRRGLQDDTIQDVVLTEKKAATKKGENYLSYLTRFTLKYTCSVLRGSTVNRVEKVAHLIIKEEPQAGEATLEHIRDLNVFNTERFILEEIIPKIEQLVGTRIGPKVYYASTEPQTIIMEDLTAVGFKNKNRKIGLNREEVCMVLERLADFHAGSVLLNEQNSGSVSRFRRGIISDKMPQVFFKMIRTSLADIGERISTWDKQFTPISEKCIERSKDIVERLFESYKSDDDELKVLNHGDVWVNNIMFQDNENGVAQDARFVDFQMSVWSSPAIDLLYFLSIAPKLDIKISHNNTFLEVYLNQLSKTMGKIGCAAKPPTMEQLKRSLHKRRAYALMAGLIFYPKMIAEDEDVESIDDLIDHGNSTVDILKNPTAQMTMKKILPLMNEKGYLD